MVPFRQPIRLNDVGSDVYAVKRALRAMKAPGASALVILGPGGKTAGGAFVDVLDAVLRQHRKTADGVYGPVAHEIIAPHFDAWGAALYAKAAIRGPKLKTAADYARALLEFHAKGKYRADNPGDLYDVQASAQGKPVRNRAGVWVMVDVRVFEVLVHLIESGFSIGTFAICSDHMNDGPHGHAGGRAVDISSINGVSVASLSTRKWVIALDRTLHASGLLVPRQLITGGCGNRRDSEISAYTIPSPGYYGSVTMGEHCNHVHVGY